MKIPTNSDWERYDAYVDRVRELHHNDSETFQRQGCPSKVTAEFLNTIAALHPRGPQAFFPPKLRSLTWILEGPPKTITPSLCERIEHLQLFAHEYNIMAGVLKRLVGMTPRLMSFRLLCYPPVKGSAESLAKLVSHCPLLKAVTLPKCCQTSSVLLALGDLVHLEELNLSYRTYGVGLEAQDDQIFAFPIDAFRRLKKISIGDPVDGLVRMFDSVRQQFAQLRDITLSSVEPRTPEQVLNLTRRLAQRCESLNAVNLDFYPRSVDFVSQYCDVSFRQLEALLACRNLTEFTIKLKRPVPITEQDLIAMGSAWPRLKRLSLSPGFSDRGQNPTRGMPLRLLPIAARLFPFLESLGAFIYSDPKDISEFDFKIFPSAEFQSLKHLDVGTSSVPAGDKTTVGFYFGALFRYEVDIGCENYLNDVPNAMGRSLVLEDWAFVGAVMHQVVRAKRATRVDHAS